MKTMNDLLDYTNYNESGFYGIPQQITDKIKEHEVATTEAIDEFKDTMHTDVTEQTEQQKVDAQENRNTFTNVFGAFTKIFRNIFTKDKGDISGETFYEMVQRENDETQAYMSAHTNMMKSESDETQRNMTAHTQAMNVDFNTLIEAIKQSTSGDTVNINKLVQALSTNTNTLKESVDNVKSTNQTGFNKVETAINNLRNV